VLGARNLCCSSQSSFENQGSILSQVTSVSECVCSHVSE